MKKISILIVAIIFVSIGFQQCKFDLLSDLSESDPVVEISDFKYENDVLTIKGNVIDEGTSKIYYTGFCYARGHVPELDENQILIEDGNLTFEAVIDDLWPNEDYYFRAFAANSNSFALSDTVHYKVSGNNSEAPCQLADNTIEFNIYSKSITYGQITEKDINNLYKVELRCNGLYLSFYFDSEPTSGIYTTVTSDDELTPAKRNVKIVMFTGSYYVIEPDDKLYVSVIDGVTTFSFCELHVDYDGTIMPVAGKATYK